MLWDLVESDLEHWKCWQLQGNQAGVSMTKQCHRPFIRAQWTVQWGVSDKQNPDKRSSSVVRSWSGPRSGRRSGPLSPGPFCGESFILIDLKHISDGIPELERPILSELPKLTSPDKSIFLSVMVISFDCLLHSSSGLWPFFKISVTWFHSPPFVRLHTSSSDQDSDWFSTSDNFKR